MPRTASKPRPEPPDADPVRERILAAFSTKARRAGIRAVLMGDLASELRMSSMTLYKHFRSKEELVTEMVEAWADELAAIDALDWDRARDCASALEVLLSWADAWTASLSRVSQAFFDDLRREHPQAWRRLNEVIDERKQVAASCLSPHLREDVKPTLVFPMLDLLVLQAANPRFVERLDVSRREAVRAAIELWGGGALRERVALRSAPD